MTKTRRPSVTHMYQSVLEWLRLPPNFGYALLIIGLVLTLAPYLRGSDFGVIKIPDFDPPVRSAMRVLGPFVLLGAILLHVELIHVAKEPTTAGQNTAVAGQSPEPPPTTPDPEAVPPASSSPQLARGPVLAPWGGGSCLYPATIVGAPTDRATLRFAFGKDGAAPNSSLRPVPEGPVTDVTPGDAVFAHLAAADAWAPGIVKEVRGSRAYVDLDPDADCAAQYGRPFLWAELNETSLIAREDGT